MKSSFPPLVAAAAALVVTLPVPVLAADAAPATGETVWLLGPFGFWWLLGVAGASLAIELSHDYILAKIKPNDSLAEFEAKALAPALTAAATIGAAYLTIGPVTDMRAALELAAVGAGSEIGGTYAH